MGLWCLHRDPYHLIDIFPRLPNYYFLLHSYFTLMVEYMKIEIRKGKKKTIILGTKGITTVDILLTSLLDFFRKCVPQNTNVFL